MSFTVAQVVNLARDQHPALAPVNTPLPIALRYLSECVRDYYQAIMVRFPAYVAVDLDVDLPLADFDAGIDLTTEIPGGWKDLLEGQFTYNDQGGNPPSHTPARYVPWEQKDMRQPLPAFTMRNNVLYFLGGENYYTNFSLFTLTYTAIPTDLTAETDAIALPDDARGSLAMMLAAFWLGRLVGDPQYRVTSDAAAVLDQRAEGKKAEFLNRIWRNTNRQAYRVRDVRGGAGGWPT